MNIDEKFNWDLFLQPYELAVEGFILKIEGIKKQYALSNQYCPIEIVSGRVKSIKSILDKAERMGLEFEEIPSRLYDIGGIRITCKYIDDVYQVAELICKRRDLKLMEVRDYIKYPKPSGYRSLHLIFKYKVETLSGSKDVTLEFQIRTHAMHFWASIEHSLKYKYQKKIPEELKQRLIEASKASEKLDEEMTNIKETISRLDKDMGVNNLDAPDPLESEININHKKW